MRLVEASLLDIPKVPVGDLVAKLRCDDHNVSGTNGQRLLREAQRYGVDIRDYLILAVEPTPEQRAAKLNGYEAFLAGMNLPIRDDFEAGITLQAASETFQTFPGARVMFPPVIEDMVRWSKRWTQFETVEPLVSQSRVIAGPEMISTVVNDDGTEYQTFVVPELGRIPVRSLRMSETSVRFYKHGSGLSTSYEFNRRASIEILAPFAARVERELQLSKVRAATNVIINGDGVHAAAPVVNQSSYNTPTGTTATNGTISRKHFLYWLIQRAKAGTPVDTVVCDWDGLYRLMEFFAPSTANVTSEADTLREVGGVALQLPNITGSRLRIVLSSACPDKKLIGITNSETLEELVEAGSQIQEQEQAILNQSITYTRTQNTGYKLIYSDTRSIFDYNA